MEKWQCNIILIFILWLIGALTLAGYTVYASAKPNTNSTVNNCTVESLPVKNEPVNPIVKNVTERIVEEKNAPDEETIRNETEIYEERFNSLSPSEQIEQREHEKAEEAAMKDTKKDSHNEENIEDDLSLSEPLANVDASESITRENKLNGGAVKKSPARTDFVIHKVDGGKETFNAYYYMEMKVGENGIVNFGEELEGAEIIVIPK